MNGAPLSELLRLVCVAPAIKHRRSWPPPLVKGDARLRQVLVNRRPPNCFSNGMIVLLCLVPARTQEPLSKFLVSPWEQKGEGDPTSLVRAVSRPVATDLSTRVPISVSTLIPVFQLWGPSPVYHSVPGVLSASIFNRDRPIPRSSTCPRPSDGRDQIVRNYDKLFWRAIKQQRKIDSCFL
ncbi:hypothetical protein B296_00042809 [Ensete ventricosum]|uniref:Uncharacterized protein n=1 Tax=Ensete ventricosum TaxID=4639 RepID=A0A426XW74_ENSVE|nr:hypothetical protein B296_00042809 [Ensete ventricosum]